MAKINMKENPFFLDEEAQEWVLDTWKKMSLEQKCGQVFCPMGLGNDPELLKHLISRWRLQRQIIQKMDIVWDLQHAKKELRLD